MFLFSMCLFVWREKCKESFRIVKPAKSPPLVERVAIIDPNFVLFTHVWRSLMLESV